MEKGRRGVVLPDAAPITASVIVLLVFLDFYGTNIWFQWSTPSQSDEQKPFNSLLTDKDKRELETTGYASDVSENSIVCVSNQQVRIDTRNNLTVHTSSRSSGRRETTVKPYALQKDKYLLQWITPVKILQGGKEDYSPPSCQYNHTVPAVIFSVGVIGNIFHEFNDIIIPLYITTKHLRSQALFVMEDYDPWFITKFGKILSRLSNYSVMNPASNKSIHCFPGMILGLKYHDNLALNPKQIPKGNSMRDFRQFLAEAYSLKFAHVSQISWPTAMLISREKTRKFLNEEEMIATMKEVGFRVVVAGTKEALDLNKFAGVVNSCGVMVGAHGAGLTNELFLPGGGVLVQVEPLGVEWAASNYYGNPAAAMGVRYLRYKMEAEESSLVELYGRNHSVITDPESVYAMGYRVVREVYLQQQDIRVDIARFRKTMIQALHLIQMHHP